MNHYVSRSLHLAISLAAVAHFSAGCAKSGTSAGSREPSGAAASTPNASAGTDTYATQRTGAIAPACGDDFCAEVSIATRMSCNDPIAEETFTMETRVEGRTSALSCAIDPSEDGSGLDLRLVVRDDDAAEGDVSELGFTLRGYTGPGRYALANVEDEGDHLGLNVRGNIPRAPGASGNSDANVGTGNCQASRCEAIVAEGSETIPTDEYSTHPFRLRVEVRCPQGATLGSFGCDDTTVCSFDATPTILGDFVCRN